MSRLRLLVMVFAATGASSGQERSVVNFQHLEHLTEQIDFLGERVSIVHVYANYPDYNWVAAMESGPEGIACVDDAGRAAVLYLTDYERRGNAGSLDKAKSLLRFVLKMQADDGQFYNFIRPDYSINTDGQTSRKSFGWWAARAMWALCHGYRVIGPLDQSFAARLKQAIDHALPYVDSVLTEYCNADTIGGLLVPRWLLYGSGADASSELMIGLTELFAADSSDRVREMIKKIGHGLMIAQDGDLRNFPHGMHRSWKTVWHMWGNGQSQALAQAGKILRDTAMVASAEKEARGFYARLLIEGFFKEMDVSRPGSKTQFEQIAYAVRPMAVGLVRLYEATGKREYLAMAGLAASWFFGNNMAGHHVYDPGTGRCFDGIRDSMTINLNSGGESTIEALYSLLEIEQYPAASRFLRHSKIRARSTPAGLYGDFASPSGEYPLTLGIDFHARGLLLMEAEKTKK